jgi:hypothetical protein
MGLQGENYEQKHEIHFFSQNGGWWSGGHVEF